jgi:hypothetical protein
MMINQNDLLKNVTKNKQKNKNSICITVIKADMGLTHFIT